MKTKIKRNIRFFNGHYIRLQKSPALFNKKSNKKFKLFLDIHSFICYYNTVARQQ